MTSRRRMLVKILEISDFFDQRLSLGSHVPFTARILPCNDSSIFQAFSPGSVVFRLKVDLAEAARRRLPSFCIGSPHSPPLFEAPACRHQLMKSESFFSRRFCPSRRYTFLSIANQLSLEAFSSFSCLFFGRPPFCRLRLVFSYFPAHGARPCSPFYSTRCRCASSSHCQIFSFFFFSFPDSGSSLV